MTKRKKILCVDDEPDMTEWLKLLLEHAGYEVKTALIGTRGEELFKTWKPDAAIVDMLLPDVDGVELVRTMKEINPDALFIMISGHGSIPKAVEAVKAGAEFFLEKPVEADGLIALIENALSGREHKQEIEKLKAQLTMGPFSSIIGETKLMKGAIMLAERIAPVDVSVLISGETGTGKELVANAIHYASRRRKGPFIKINCSAIPKDLLESELFGYKKGAFTGASYDKEGLLEMAEGGSLLLDEIGEMPPFLQTKLLRVLQEREFRPIGSDRIVHVDFRLICATNMNPEEAVADGRIREDLFYRINTITLKMPALRERPDDIAPLCKHFMEKLQIRHSLPKVPAISVEAFGVLAKYSWPGNIRQLENAIEYAILVCQGDEIQIADLPEKIQISLTEQAVQNALNAEPSGTKNKLGDELAQIEKAAIIATLQRFYWNITRTAEELGIHRQALYVKMRKLGIAKQ